MKKYFITKKEYNGEVVYINTSKVNGYKISPKSDLKYDGIKINEMVVIKPSMIEKIIKRKIKIRLDNYLKYILYYLEDSSSDDTRKALDDLQRYKTLVNDKYSIYLDDKYMFLLNKKIGTYERELKSKLIFSSLINQKEEIEETKHR